MVALEHQAQNRDQMRLKGLLKIFYMEGIADLFITAAELWHKDVPKIMVWAGSYVQVK